MLPGRRKFGLLRPSSRAEHTGEFRQFCDLLRFFAQIVAMCVPSLHLLRFFGGEIPCRPVVVGFFGILARAASKCDLSSKRMAPALG